MSPHSLWDIDMLDTSPNRAAVSISEAREMLGGIANGTIYRLIGDGELLTFRVGRRRLVGIDAIYDYISRAERDTPLIKSGEHIEAA